MKTIKKKFTSFSNKNKKILTALFLFILFCITYANMYKKIPLRYWDEQAWIGRSYFFDLFVNKDIDNPLWSTYYSYNQPKLAEYMYGLVLYPRYLRYKNIYPNSDYITFLIDNNFFEVNTNKYIAYKNKINFIDWGKDPIKVFDVNPNLLLDKFGPDINKTIDLIYSARTINIINLSLSVVIAFILTKRISTLPISLMTSTFFGLNYLLITSGLRVHSEGLFILLFLFGIYETLLYFGKIFIKNTFSPHIILLGFSYALVSQTKLNGIMLLFFANFLLLSRAVVQSIKNKINKLKISTFNILVLNLFFFISFVSLHPYLQQSPLKNIMNVYKYKSVQASDQAKQYPDFNLTSFASRIKHIYYNFLLNPKEHCHYNGVYFFNLKSCSINIFFYAKLLAFIFGLIAFIYKTHLHRDVQNILFLMLFIFLQIVMGFYLVLDWDRYYVHLIYFFTFFTVYGSITIIRIFHGFVSSIILRRMV